MKNSFKIIGALISIVLIIALFVGLGWAWRYATAPIEGRVAAEEQIESASSRITNYEHFFDLCAAGKSMAQKIEVQNSLLPDAETTRERSRIRTRIGGMRARLSDIVNKYNVDARKSYTSARFLGDSLPRRLEIENMENVVCSQ